MMRLSDSSIRTPGNDAAGGDRQTTPQQSRCLDFLTLSVSVARHKPELVQWIRRRAARFNVVLVALPMLLVISAFAGTAAAQVRLKRPDRDVYRPPQIRRQDAGSNPTRDGLVTAAVEDFQANRFKSSAQARTQATLQKHATLQRVDHQVVGLRPAPSRNETESGRTDPSSEFAGAAAVGRAVTDEEQLQPLESPQVAPEDREGIVPYHGPEIAGSWLSGDTYSYLDDGACDAIGCDATGCDACGNAQRWSGIGKDWANASISFNPSQWFGSIEVLLMFRNGDGLPPLVTSGPDSDADTAGQLGQVGTSVLFPSGTVLKDMTAGGRLMLGTWLDSRQCRSLTLRGWFAGEESYGFHLDGDTTPVIARPFFNISDAPPQQDTQLIAFPERADGFLDIRGDSNVHGGDIAVRQYWFGGLGGSVDVLYGYQYMRLDERLAISSTSVSLDDDFAPVGAVLSVADSFEAENDFHGGQLGIAARYRERCWSFDGLLKFGFGRLRREATRTGSTLTSIDGANAFDDQGLLVRESNRGTVTDDTFGWIPELDLSLGWQRFPRFDVTCGYHLIVMTDALQVSGAIDRDLAVDLGDPPAAPRPAPDLRFDTFYVQGIHFGLKYVY